MSQTDNIFKRIPYSKKSSDSHFTNNIVDTITLKDEDGDPDESAFFVQMGSNFHGVESYAYSNEDGMESSIEMLQCYEDFPMKVGDVYKHDNINREEWEQYDKEFVVLQISERIMQQRKTYSIAYAAKDSPQVQDPQSLNLANADDHLYHESELVNHCHRIFRAYRANTEELVLTGENIPITRDFFEEWATEPITLFLDIHLKKYDDGTFHMNMSYKASPRCLHDGGYLGAIEDYKNFDMNKFIEQEKKDLQRNCGARRPITVKAKIKDDRITQSLDSFF